MRCAPVVTVYFERATRPRQGVSSFCAGGYVRLAAQQHREIGQNLQRNFRALRGVTCGDVCFMYLSKKSVIEDVSQARYPRSKWSRPE